MALPLLIAALGAAGALAITPAQRVTLSGRQIVLGDVVTGRVLPPRLAGRVIAVLPPARSHVTLSRAALARLVRRAAPAIGPLATGTGTLTLWSRPVAATRRDAAACYALGADVARGRPLVPAMLRATSCRPSAGIALRFDRHTRLPVALGDSVAGAYVGRLAPAPAPAVGTGDTLRLVSVAGPVRVERPVTALQPARGARLFVRDADGQVFAAPLAAQAAP